MRLFARGRFMFQSHLTKINRAKALNPSIELRQHLNPGETVRSNCANREQEALELAQLIYDVFREKKLADKIVAEKMEETHV